MSAADVRADFAVRAAECAAGGRASVHVVCPRDVHEIDMAHDIIYELSRRGAELIRRVDCARLTFRVPIAPDRSRLCVCVISATPAEARLEPHQHSALLVSERDARDRLLRSELIEPLKEAKGIEVHVLAND